MEGGAAHELATGPRHLAVDEQGVGLRLTFRLDRGFVNLSLWRHDRCVETFHLTPADASSLVAFLVEGLAHAVPPPARPNLSVASMPRAVPAPRNTIGRTAARARNALADLLQSGARRLRG